jgi:hypothetical protein
MIEGENRRQLVSDQAGLTEWTLEALFGGCHTDVARRSAACAFLYVSSSSVSSSVARHGLGRALRSMSISRPSRQHPPSTTCAGSTSAEHRPRDLLHLVPLAERRIPTEDGEVVRVTGRTQFPSKPGRPPRPPLPTRAAARA